MTSRNRPTSPHFHTIKAVFESSNTSRPPPTYLTSHASSPGPSTNRDVSNPASNIISREASENAPDTIDTVFGSPAIPINTPSRFHTRTPVYLKPAWIGPPRATRAATPSAMSHKVTITYASPGLQPPVYVTTSLSEPGWDVLEMGVSPLPDGEYEFAKTFHVHEGQYQYKFRLGPGDWWVCDEGMPIVDDGLGNRNNLLIVKDEALADSLERTKDAAEPEPAVPQEEDTWQPLSGGKANPSPNRSPIHEELPTPSEEVLPKKDSLAEYVFQQPTEGYKTHVDEAREDAAPLFAHESNSHSHLELPPEDVPVNFSRMDTQPVLDNSDAAESSHYPSSPVFRHESLAAPGPDTLQLSPDRTPGVSEDDDDILEQLPRMHHEPAGPDGVEANHAPLFNHELIGMSSPHQDDRSRTSRLPSSQPDSKLFNLDDIIPKEADPNDPSLEQFPTHHDGIISSLRRASLRIAGEESTDALHESLSVHTKSAGPSSPASSSMPSVREDDEESEDTPISKSDGKADPLHMGAQDFSSGPQMHIAATGRPAALITPPRTPDASIETILQAPHVSDHHHKSIAEKDMLQEAKHDVKHSDHQHKPDHILENYAEPALGMDDGGPAETGEAMVHGHETARGQSKSKIKPVKAGLEIEKKSAFVSFMDAVFGLGLVMVIGAAAAWIAYKMQDANKDGVAAMAGA